jgi:hypothetical protein
MLCHFANCHHFECHVLFNVMLSVVTLSVIMLSVVEPLVGGNIRPTSKLTHFLGTLLGLRPRHLVDPIYRVRFGQLHNENLPQHRVFH